MSKEIVSSKDMEILEKVRKQIIEDKRNITKTYLDLAEKLYYVRNAKVKGKTVYNIWGYTTFQEYCDKELNMSDRKAELLIHIYLFASKMVELSQSKNKEYVVSEIDSVGWAKASLLTKVVNTPKELPTWIDKAKQMSVKDLKALIVGDSKVFNGELSDNEGRFLSYNFKVLKSGKDVVDSTLEHIRQVNGENIISGPAGDGMCLVRLCQHYLSNLSDFNFDLESLLGSIMENHNIVKMTIEYANGEKVDLSLASKVAESQK